MPQQVVVRGVDGNHHRAGCLELSVVSSKPDSSSLHVIVSREGPAKAGEYYAVAHALCLRHRAGSNDVIAGRIQVVINAYPPLVDAMQAGHVRPLAVGSDKRFAAFRDVATLRETLPGFSSNGWLALAAPLGTPDAMCRS
ncbi:MAG: hypothetical protein K2Z80_37075 [Xanthobacteraceae bacterium]|nr:hypothetical protein [Xanthobacteraceae bacterium]